MYLKLAEWIHLETSKSAEIGRQVKTKCYYLASTTVSFFPLWSRLGLSWSCPGLGSVLVSV